MNISKEYSLEVIGQKYFDCEKDRAYTLYFSVPDNPEEGDRKMGICLLISGFGADANSNVYRKMRREFADRENLVVVQCDYFGYEFMGKELDAAIEKEAYHLTEFFSPEECRKIQKGEFDCENEVPRQYAYLVPEMKENFCEMGLLQAMDNLRSVKIVMDILEQNQMDYSRERILCYGHSQGAYLAYLCNALAPDLFSGIIDNSAWLLPIYLMKPRKRLSFYCIFDYASGKIYLKQSKETAGDRPGILLEIYAEYQGKRWIDDMEAYSLNVIYEQVENHAKIISVHGKKDSLISVKDKEDFIKKIPNAVLHIVHEDEIDGSLFMNTEHGLGADFLELFYAVCSRESLQRSGKQKDIWKGAVFESLQYIYYTLLENGVPVLKRKLKPEYI